ncbi:MAG: hypothetical protein RIM33_11535 [Alphaproteobacteria bacterium]
MPVKALIDAIHFNNRLLEERTQIWRRLQTVDDRWVQTLKLDLGNVESRLREYGGQLKEAHERLKTAYAEAEAAVREYLGKG